MAKRVLTIFLLIILFNLGLFIQKAFAATLTNVSVSATSYEPAATATYTLTFTTATNLGASPNIVPQVIFPSSFDWSNVSMPADYSVTVNGSPATLDASAFDVGNGYFGIRLTSGVSAGSTVAVTVTNVKNPSIPGDYTFVIFRTALGGGQTVDEPATLPVVTIASSTRTLSYTTGTGGTLSGAADQIVSVGGNGTAVTAVPDVGQHFYGWSDGSEDNPRIDTNVTTNISVIAIFAPNQYDVEYSAGVNGSITGTTSQIINYGGNSSLVTAVPNTGYRFVKWSDNLTDNPRMDMNVTEDISVTAIFELATFTAINTPAGVQVTPEDSDYDFTAGIPQGSTIWILIKDADGNLIAKSLVEFDSDLNLADLEIGMDANNYKSFVHGLDNEFDLYVPKRGSDTKVKVCPAAASLADVTVNCAGGYELGESAENVSVVSIGGNSFWVISGLSGTGAFSIATADPGLATTGINIARSAAVLGFVSLILIVVSFLENLTRLQQLKNALFGSGIEV